MPAKTETPTAARKLIPLSKWNETHSYPPTGTLRHLVFNCETNGFDRCVRRLGRRILIDEAAFFEWIDTQNGKAATHG